MNPEALEAAVIGFCERVGRDPLLVQGAGGNVSWKQEGTLYVKASGTWLSEAAAKNIFVPIDLDRTRSAIASGRFEVPAEAVGHSDLRPSIETLLHALMPHRVVVHLHSVEVIARVVRKHWREDLQQCCGQAFRWAAIPYEQPGADLARAVQGAVDNGERPDVLFLQNHGVVVGADDVDGVIDLLDRVLEAVRSPLAFDAEPLPAAQGSYVPVNSGVVQALAAPDALASVEQGWAISPDHVVFLGPSPTIVESVDDAESAELIFVRNRGVFVDASFSIAKTEQLQCYAEVLRRQVLPTTLHELTVTEVDALLDWDAEKYRQRMSK